MSYYSSLTGAGTRYILVFKFFSLLNCFNNSQSLVFYDLTLFLFEDFPGNKDNTLFISFLRKIYQSFN